MDVTGPVFLTAYNEEINSANLYERAQFHSEFNFEAGSIQKRAFLTVLGGKILERIFSLDGGELVTLAGSMQKSLDEKHLLIDIPNSPLTAYLQENGWDGRLAYTAGDYLYVVNANLGGTKANYYVKNDMEYDVFSATRDGLLRAELVLTYTHTGKDSSWPGGPYTNYVRVLAQTGAKLTNAQIVFSDGTTQDVFGNVITSKVKDYTAFELGFVLQPDQTATLLLGYDLAQNLALTPETNTYDLYWQKQPGTQDDNINFKFSAPFGVDIINTNPPMTVGGTTAEYTGVLNSDTEMHVEFN